MITQYQSHTLVQHIQRGWSFFSEEMNEFVDLLPAQQRVHGENWYRGTADAVTQNLDIIRRYKAEYVVILAGDHIYKQDYYAHADRPCRKRRALHRRLFFFFFNTSAMFLLFFTRYSSSC